MTTRSTGEKFTCSLKERYKKIKWPRMAKHRTLCLKLMLKYNPEISLRVLINYFKQTIYYDNTGCGTIKTVGLK